MEEFKKTWQYKNIKSFGTLLIVSGALSLFLDFSPYFFSPLILISIPASIWFIAIGNDIRNFRLSPDEILDKLTTIKLAAFFTSLALFVWIDCHGYKKKWYPAYAEAMGESKKSAGRKKIEKREIEEKSDSKQTDDDEL